MRLNGCSSFLLGVIVAVYPTVPSIAQSAFADAHPTPAATRNDLVSLFQAEGRRGTSISYAQAYRVHGSRVEFHGSIFGAIQDVQTDGCELKIKTLLVDVYAGNIGRKRVGRTQTKYLSSIAFKLTPAIAADLKIVDLRPVRQLAEDTNVACSENRQCTLTWLRVKGDAPVIQMTEIANDRADYDGDVKDFDGPVEQFLLPLSSADAGYELIEKMRAFARSCGD